LGFFKKFSHAINPPQNRDIGLALAGGGSWGAFTWGALTALIEKGIITEDNLKAVSGTSAGAANAAPVSFAANEGDIKKAAAWLALFWSKIIERGDSAGLLMMQASLGEAFPNLNRTAVEQGKHMTRLLQTWGITSQPGALGSAIESTLGRDWSAIHNGPVKTYIGTAAVGRTMGGRGLTHKTFTNREITPKVIAASGTIIGTTTINGRDYEDGAFLKNPSVSEVEGEGVKDLIAIMLYPTPTSPIPAVHEDHIKPGQSGFVGPEAYQHLAWVRKNNPGMNVHVIGMDMRKAFPNLNETSKMNISRDWLETLYQAGYDQTMDWIAKNAHHIGKRSTFMPSLGSGPAPATKPELEVA